MVLSIQQHSLTPSNPIKTSEAPKEQSGKRKRTSDVWEYFEKEVTYGKVKVFYKNYRTLLAKNFRVRTFHLRKHIEKTCNAID